MTKAPFLHQLDVLAEGDPEIELATIPEWRFVAEFDWHGFSELLDAADHKQLPDIKVDSADIPFELRLSTAYFWPEFFEDIPGISVLSCKGPEHSMVSGTGYTIVLNRPELRDRITARLRAAISALEAASARLSD